MHYKFLIYISHSYSVPIGLPLEKEIIKRGYKVQWFSDIKEGHVALHSKENVLENIKDVIAYEPHIVLTATNEVPDFISGIKVQIFHGFLTYKRPEKKNGDAHFRIRGFFDLYCTQGPSTTTGFKRQQKQNPSFEVIETGWAKVDPLFPLEDVSTTSDLPTIFIASTFTPRLSLAYNAAVFNEIKKLSSTGQFKFMMVLHPKLPEDIKQKWHALNNEHFQYYDTTDLVPLFKKADIMFADTTSAIQEFLLQKKPVVTFNHTFNHNYLINISEASQIKESFKTALAKPQNLIKNIATFVAELHPYYDGKSSERIVDTTIEFLHKDKSYLKRKPLNLIRKYKIRKRLNYFTFKSYSKPYTKKRNL
ncbi:CDP-glycerol glycerophosphotransferase [Bizionia gelidisalsuginis]|uniref:CDP-glycerol glycerophosphotransferase n=2 Tax=Bizionia TaxID=283785 RepID=A0A8H2LJ82_9FLAO|nr:MULTISPECIES: UDP-N-acetylglucosamine 2-epimerase [Bizionia]TYB80247.1 CDP-glycerol glycerophosphotransferase [Bizionia saleffrena]TYC17090.1 CDP-glycerol glycerophosphotransferase [Bizionia gelidisalsuginis]